MYIQFVIPIIFEQHFKPMAANVGSYTQGRIGGDLANAVLWFLASRKAAWSERCSPKATAAELEGS